VVNALASLIMPVKTSNPKELEGPVLKESIVSATGLSPARLEVEIKGDPSVRETAMARSRYTSWVDTSEDFQPFLEDNLP
jgi:hypothetical protein